MPLKLVNYKTRTDQNSTYNIDCVYSFNYHVTVYPIIPYATRTPQDNVRLRSGQ